MSILDSIAAVRRATAQLGQPDGAGQCLANVYKWFGSVPSIGPGSGHYGVAIAGWEYAPAADRHPGDYNPPAGVPVYFDRVTAPRWPGDHNMAAGDVGLSIGGGRAIFTDSPTGNTGVMSIAARAAQIGRRYLGWTGTFLGHETTAGNAYGKPTPPAVVVKVGAVSVKTLIPGADMSIVIRNNAKGKPGFGDTFALGLGQVKHLNDGDVAMRGVKAVGNLLEANDVNTLKDTFEAFNVPREAADPGWLAAHQNAGALAYSSIVAALKK